MLHGQHVGLVDHDLRIVGHQLQRTAEGAAGLGVALHHRVAAPEHDPAFGVGHIAGRLLFHALGQLGDHGLHFMRRRRALRAPWPAATAPTGVPICAYRPSASTGTATSSSSSVARGEPSRIGAAATLSSSSTRRSISARVALVLCRVDARPRPGRDRSAAAAPSAAPGSTGWRFAPRAARRWLAPQRAHHHPHRQQQQRRCNHPEQAHARLFSSPSRRRTRSASSACSGAPAGLRRRRMFRARPTSATPSSTKGPPHSSQVLLFTGGR